MNSTHILLKKINSKVLPKLAVQKRYKSCDDDNPVKDKTILVTGGAAGIGYACVENFLSNQAKAVIIGDINEKKGEKMICKLSEKYGDDKIMFVKTDSSNGNQIKNLFKCAVDAYKQLDIVMNCAGIMQDCQWEKECQVNVFGTVFCTLMGFHTMGKHNKGCGGTILNVSSLLGLKPLSGCPVYTATKHFIVGFDRSIGDCFYEKLTGIRVLTLCPGVTDTGLISEAEQYALQGFGNVAKMLDEQLKVQPMQPAKSVACHAIKVLKRGKSGSIWVSEDNELFRIKIPERKTYKIK